MNFTQKISLEILYPLSRKSYILDHEREIKNKCAEHKIKVYINNNDKSIDSKDDKSIDSKDDNKIDSKDDNKILIRTRSSTIDPLAIFTVKSFITLICRGVDIKYAELVFKGKNHLIIDISLKKKRIFLKRRDRLIGPDGKTLDMIRMLTSCHLFVYGHTVAIIGDKVEQAREIVEDVMKNIHPVYKIKEQMIKNEFVGKDVNWRDYVPKIKKSLRRKKNKSFKKNKNKSNKLFPDPPRKRKEDFLIENGEYFKDKGK
ncbi:KRR1 small subunit processome component like protein [Dictyocoela muelleri]|nr:KRR1 small subunit processome component like protein [Dictyocoela muelleri]